MLSRKTTSLFSKLNRIFSKDQTLYDMLQVEPSSTPLQIKEAYFKIVKTCHPDLNTDDPTAEETFKALAKAYETLKDPTSRRQYDLSMHEPTFSADNYKDNPYYDHSNDEFYRQKGQSVKYYHNKWYGYKAPKGENQHDEYEEYTETRREQERQKAKYRAGVKIAMFFGGVMLFDLVSEWARHQHRQFYRH